MKVLRATAGMLVALMLANLVSLPVAQAQIFGRRPTTHRQGLSTRNKVLLLAGAAALYYLYRRHQNAKAEGVNGKYYRSRNGRIYYRDQNHQVHWVTPPTRPIPVSAEDYYRYTGRRYNGSSGVINDAPAGAF